MKRIVFAMFFVVLAGCTQLSMERDVNKIFELAENARGYEDIIILKAYITSLDGRYKGEDLLEFKKLMTAKLEEKKAKGEDCSKIQGVMLLMTFD